MSKKPKVAGNGAGMEIVPSGGGVGAFVRHVDLRSVGKAEAKALRKAIGDYGVLFFRKQKLDPESHVSLAEKIGHININRFFTALDGHPKVATVGKEPEQKANIGGNWHTDHSYDMEPALGSILVAVETPPHGGDTLFANTCAAYDALSDGLKKTLRGLKAVHSSRHVFGEGASEEQKAILAELQHHSAEKATQDSIHPVVIKHPISGKPSLYINPEFTVRFDGWTAEESRPLFDYLRQHVTRPEFTYRFQWEKGSVAFWDNRATWHYAVNDYHGHRRLMHRITIEGEQPLAA